VSPEPELVEAADDGVLPLIARLGADPPRYFVKSGRVGGAEGERGSREITSADREGALAAARSSDAQWERDPDLDAELLASGAEGVDEELLVPRFLYRRADRIYEYAAAMPEAKQRFDELISA
jgi:ATP-dependent phosphoenolpyruvate carboxykinase